MLFVRALASRVPSTSPLFVNAIEPGFCRTGLSRELEQKLATRIAFGIFAALFARKPEEGGRAIAHGALVVDPRKAMHKKEAAQFDGYNDAKALHGKYIANTRITEESDFVISEDGRRMAERVWVSEYICHALLV